MFAPKPRDYSYVLNKKVKRLALKSVLSAKAAEGQMVVIDSIKMDAIKTADFRKFLTAVKCGRQGHGGDPRGGADRGQERPEHPRRP